jgi:glycogen(starch) synthase
VLHAHDWAVNSAIDPARRRGIPLVLTQHVYNHVCATKRLMRGGELCPGTGRVYSLRLLEARSDRGSRCGAGQCCVVAIPRRWVAAFVPVSSIAAVDTGLPGRSPYEVIPNFVSDDLVVEDADPQPDGPVLFVGDVTRDKGIAVLIAAYRCLGNAPRLGLAGRLLDESPLDLPDGVGLLGLLDHDAITALMRTASVVVVPSIVSDGCPTVVLEAMAAGRPVIVAASGESWTPPRMGSPECWLPWVIPSHWPLHSPR